MNEQDQLIEAIFQIGSKSTKYPLKDKRQVPQIIQMIGEEGLKALIEGLQKVRSEEEAVAVYDAIRDQASKARMAKLGGVLNYINKLNNR